MEHFPPSAQDSWMNVRCKWLVWLRITEGEGISIFQCHYLRFIKVDYYETFSRIITRLSWWAITNGINFHKLGTLWEPIMRLPHKYWSWTSPSEPSLGSDARPQARSSGGDLEEGVLRGKANTLLWGDLSWTGRLETFSILLHPPVNSQKKTRAIKWSLSSPLL